MNPTEEYNAYLESKKLMDFNTMTLTQIQEVMANEFKLRSLSEKYEAQVQVDIQNNEATFRENRRNSIINHMVTNGYSGTGSLEDFKSFYNKPEWFGDNWENKAIEHYNNAEDKLQSFMDLYLQYYPI